MKRFHAAGFFAALTTLSGVLISPAFLSVVPARYAAGVTMLGLIAQAFTKGVQHGGTDLVPKVNPLELPPPEEQP